MTIWLVLGIALALLGVAAFVILQWPEVSQKKRKKKRLPAPEPEKNWKEIAERLEKRVQTLERAAQASQAEIRGRDKKMEDLLALAEDAKKKLAQEKIWREKGEALAAKEKRQERALQEELQKTRGELNSESMMRIKLDQEAKDLRQIRDDQGAQIRKLSSQNMDLDKRLTDATGELKTLRAENIELRKKKEDEEWVAKSDYKRVESLLKRARWEVDQFKKGIPSADWPPALQPKTVTPSAAVSPAVVRNEPLSSTNNEQQGAG